jgi:hypothetical protein
MDRREKAAKKSKYQQEETEITERKMNAGRSLCFLCYLLFIAF